MKFCIAAVLLAVLVASALCLDCPECNRNECKDVKCRFGLTTDACGCCPACYKGVGEECGGPWNVKGLCAPPWFCMKPLRPDGKTDPVHEFNAVGKCVALP